MARTAKPAASDAAPQAASATASAPRVRVRTVAALGHDGRRYRAGLGPFGRAAVEVAPTRAQLDALRADPFLIVEEA